MFNHCIMQLNQLISKQISSEVFFYIFIAVNAGIKQADSCSISPLAAAVVAGNSISVTCTPDAGKEVFTWRRDTDALSATSVYNTAEYSSSGQLTNPRYVAPGYNASTDGQVLTMNNITNTYFGFYFCCFSRTNSCSTYISVIDSEPQFVASDSLRVEDPIVLTCSLSLTGMANSSIKIVDYSGNVLINNFTSISSSTSVQHSVTYTIPHFNETVFFCNIKLTTDTNEGASITAFTRQPNVTMHFLNRQPSLFSENQQACQDGGLCKQNVQLFCLFDGMSAPYYQWTIYIDGTVSSFNSTANNYSTQHIGQQTIQCTAKKRIKDTFYFGSMNFTTNVTTDVYTRPTASPTTSGSDNKSLAIGLGVGLGVGVTLLIIIIIIVLCLCKRKKRSADSTRDSGNITPVLTPQQAQKYRFAPVSFGPKRATYFQNPDSIYTVQYVWQRNL